MGQRLYAHLAAFYSSRDKTRYSGIRFLIFVFDKTSWRVCFRSMFSSLVRGKMIIFQFCIYIRSASLLNGRKNYFLIKFRTERKRVFSMLIVELFEKLNSRKRISRQRGTKNNR